MAKMLTADVPPVAQASDDQTVVGTVDKAGQVTSVTYTPEAAVTGVDADTRTLSLINKGQSGAGTTVIASLDLVDTVNLTAFDEKALTLHATVANRNVAANDVLAWKSDATGAGIVDPGGLVKVSITRG